jgi:hypothetical protein
MPCKNCNCGKTIGADALKKCDDEYQGWLEVGGLELLEVPIEIIEELEGKNESYSKFSGN